ncbi:MAG: hypothetical protein KDC54_06690 [Lewinella sp.]|nr:hypothetical protein [Lewinella sp.]
MRISNKPPIGWYSAFIIAVLLSCAQQSPADPVAAAEPAPVIDRARLDGSDTTLYLKFTSGIRSILEDSRGNFWFGSHQEGLARFDGERITYFTLEDGLSDGQIRTIREDANGLIWFEGGRGLSYHDGIRITEATVRDYSAIHDWHSAPTDLWFKGDEVNGYNAREEQPGVYRFDGSRLIFQAFPIRVGAGEESYYSVSTPAVKGKDGKVWFGTYGAVIGYDGHSFTVIDDKLLGLNEETGFLHVRSLFEDSRGNLWIGNNGIGVLKFDGETIENFSEQQGLVHPDSQHSGQTSPPGTLEHVFSIGEDRDGNLWFGDRDTGAWRFDGQSLDNYTQVDGLPTTHIWAMYRDRQDILWFGMGDGSVCRFIGDSFVKVF